MIALLIDNPLLLLFIVTAIGYPLGQIKVRGTSLGVAAVLFVGLAIGSLDPNLKLPEIIYTLGLALFVFSIGLSSGPGFVASFRRAGLRDNLLVIGMVIFAAIVTVALAASMLIFRPIMDRVCTLTRLHVISRARLLTETGRTWIISRRLRSA